MRILKILDKNFEEFILAILIAVIVSVMFAQVILRYCFNISPPWTEELCRYCYIYFMFIGTSYAIKQNNHLKVDAVVLMLPKKVANAILIIMDMIIIVMLAYLLYACIPMVADLKASGNYSPGLKLPVYIVYLAAPIGLGLSVIRFIQRYVLVFKARGKDKEEKA